MASKTKGTYDYVFKVGADASEVAKAIEASYEGAKAKVEKDRMYLTCDITPDEKGMKKLASLVKTKSEGLSKDLRIQLDDAKYSGAAKQLETIATLQKKIQNNNKNYKTGRSTLNPTVDSLIKNGLQLGKTDIAKVQEKALNIFNAKKGEEGYFSHKSTRGMSATDYSNEYVRATQALQQFNSLQKTVDDRMKTGAWKGDNDKTVALQSQIKELNALGTYLTGLNKNAFGFIGDIPMDGITSKMNEVDTAVSGISANLTERVATLQTQMQTQMQPLIDMFTKALNSEMHVGNMEYVDDEFKKIAADAKQVESTITNIDARIKQLAVDGVLVNPFKGLNNVELESSIDSNLKQIEELETKSKKLTEVKDRLPYREQINSLKSDVGAAYKVLEENKFSSPFLKQYEKNPIVKKAVQMYEMRSVGNNESFEEVNKLTEQKETLANQLAEMQAKLKTASVKQAGTGTATTATTTVKGTGAGTGTGTDDGSGDEANTAKTGQPVEVPVVPKFDPVAFTSEVQAKLDASATHVNVNAKPIMNSEAEGEEALSQKMNVDLEPNMAGLNAKIQERKAELSPITVDLHITDGNAEGEAAQATTAGAQGISSVEASVESLKASINSQMEAFGGLKTKIASTSTEAATEINKIIGTITALSEAITGVPNLDVNITGMENFPSLEQISKINFTPLKDSLTTQSAQQADASVKGAATKTEQAKAAISSDLFAKLEQLNSVVAKLDVAKLNKIQINPQAFEALRLLTEDDVITLELLTEVLERLKATEFTKDKLAGLKNLSNLNSEKILSASTAIESFATSMTQMTGVSSSIEQIDSLITKIATLKGVVDSVQNITVKVIEDTDKGTTTAKTTTEKDATKETSADSNEISSVTALETAYKKLAQQRILNSKASSNTSIKTNLQLTQEAQRLAVIEDLENRINAARKNGITSKMAEDYDSRLVKALAVDEQAIKDNPISSTTETRNRTYFDRSTSINPFEYINSEAIRDAQGSISGTYSKLINGNFKTKQEADLANQSLAEQSRLLQELTKVSNKVTNSKGTLIASNLQPSKDGSYNLQSQKAEILRAVSNSVNGTVKSHQFSNDYSRLNFEADNGNGSISKMTANIDRASGSIRTCLNTEKEYVGFSKRWATNITSKIKSLTQYVTSIQIVMRAWQAIKQGFEFVKTLDASLTAINLTMAVSSSKLKELGDSAIRAAQDLGTTATQVLDVAKVYANMQTTPEQIIELAKPTIMLSNASGIEASTASDYIQSVLQQFEMTDDEAQHIVDVYESLSANIKVDFADGINRIAEGVQTAGALVHEAGFSFSDFGAIVAKTTEKTRQSGSVIGNAWKTIVSRISKASDVTDEEVDTATLSAASKSLSKGGIEVYNADGSFKNLKTTLGELSSIWNTLTDAQQAEISYNVAGIRNKNQFAVAIKSYAEAMELSTTAENDSTTATINQEKHMDSVAAKANTLSATASEMWTNLLESQGMKDLLDFLTKAISGVEKFTDTFGLLGTVITAIGLAQVFKTMKPGTGRANYTVDPHSEYAREFFKRMTLIAS